MTFAAVAIGGAGLMAGSMGVQGYFGNKSSKRAARAANDAYGKLIEARGRAINYQKPYEASGRTGLNQLTQLLTGNIIDEKGQTTGTLTPEQRLAMFQTSPGYQFRLQQGQNSIQNLLASKGGLKSGAAMRALEEYAQGTASSEYGNQIGYLNNLANIGQNSANMLSNIEMQSGGAGAAYVQQAGMAMANRDAQMGNIIGGGMSQIGGTMFGMGMQGMSGQSKSPSGFTSVGGGQYNSRAFMNSNMGSINTNLQ